MTKPIQQDFLVVTVFLNTDEDASAVVERLTRAARQPAANAVVAMVAVHDPGPDSLAKWGSVANLAKATALHPNSRPASFADGAAIVELPSRKETL
jgi:hypothetical protein